MHLRLASVLQDSDSNSVESLQHAAELANSRLPNFFEQVPGFRGGNLMKLINQEVNVAFQGVERSCRPLATSSWQTGSMRRPLTWKWRYVSAWGPLVALAALSRSQKRCQTGSGQDVPWGGRGAAGMLRIHCRRMHKISNRYEIIIRMDGC